VQSTVTFQVPGVVLSYTFHVHDTRPSDPAVWGSSPRAFDGPLLYITPGVQVAPGTTLTASVALAPLAMGEVRLTNVMPAVGSGLAVGEDTRVGGTVVNVGGTVGVVVGLGVRVGVAICVGTTVGTGVSVASGASVDVGRGVSVG
jgi:hypothetical protein